MKNNKNNLNLNKEQTVHTNPDGSKVKVRVVTEDAYFSKRLKKKHKTTSGSSGLFPNHVEFNGWLSFNDLQCIDLEETEEWEKV